MYTYKEYMFCSHCQSVRSVNVSISVRPATDPAATGESTLLLNYHCDTCGSLVCQTPVNHEQVMPDFDFNSTTQP